MYPSAPIQLSHMPQDFLGLIKPSGDLACQRELQSLAVMLAAGLEYFILLWAVVHLNPHRFVTTYFEKY